MDKAQKYMMVCIIIALSGIIAACSANVAQQEIKQKASGKEIVIKGSDTIVQLVANLAEAYSVNNPSVRLSVTGGGSGTGIAALINGEVEIADSSRAIKDKELKQAEANGIKALEFIIARDMLSVIVNPDNPIDRLTIEQVSRIFKGEITNWKDVGGNNEKISLFGRQSTSGTYIYFQEEVVKDDYSPEMRNMEGTQAIVDATRQDKSSIGYAGLGYIVDENGKLLDGIKVVQIAKDGDSEFITPLDASKIADYAINRPLFQYVVQKPDAFASYNFILFELSKEGQDIVKSSGYDKILEQDRLQNEKVLGLIAELS
ncbi:TPA: PstS family phosphate ABC transporter substrate-binding protein [Candidatus Woesearchaeota archaeon]|nr:PstS family phosphate ABC transporter substrate-binding protein [Candidatus Woesearchaeota archaeon]